MPRFCHEQPTVSTVGRASDGLKAPSIRFDRVTLDLQSVPAVFEVRDFTSLGKP